jgi:hypothetical protein
MWGCSSTRCYGRPRGQRAGSVDQTHHAGPDRRSPPNCSFQSMGQGGSIGRQAGSGFACMPSSSMRAALTIRRVTSLDVGRIEGPDLGYCLPSGCNRANTFGQSAQWLELSGRRQVSKVAARQRRRQMALGFDGDQVSLSLYSRISLPLAFRLTGKKHLFRASRRSLASRLCQREMHRRALP